MAANLGGETHPPKFCQARNDRIGPAHPHDPAPHFHVNTPVHHTGRRHRFQTPAHLIAGFRPPQGARFRRCRPSRAGKENGHTELALIQPHVGGPCTDHRPQQAPEMTASEADRTQKQIHRSENKTAAPRPKSHVQNALIGTATPYRGPKPKSLRREYLSKVQMPLQLFQILRGARASAGGSAPFLFIKRLAAQPLRWIRRLSAGVGSGPCYRGSSR